MAMMLGALADLIGRNRNLMEQTLERMRKLEDRLKVWRTIGNVIWRRKRSRKNTIYSPLNCERQ